MRKTVLIVMTICLPLLGGTFLALPAFPEAPIEIQPQASYQEQLFSSQQFPEYLDSTSLVPEKWEVSNADFETMAQRWVKHFGFSGTILVARGGEIVHTGAYGLANDKTGEKMQLESVFQLASVSKMFTATAIMMLYDEKRLSFDDRLSDLIPEWPYKKMTIRHLLSHQSGLQRYDGLTRNVWDARNFMSYADVLDIFIDKKPPLNFQPGTDFAYNNTNYVILSALVEYLVGVPFEQYLETRIFQPLGMKSTYFCNHRDRLEKPNHTIGYKKAGWRNKPAEGDYLDGVYGDKGLHSTVIDLYKFDRALAEGRVLNPATLSMAYEPIASSGQGRSYGFGIRMKERWLGLGYHFGWWRGYRTAFIRDLQADQTVIVLSNRDNPNSVVNFWDAFYLLNDWR